MAVASHSYARDEPTNHWAVEVPDGDRVADDVARRHGFINHGKVSVTIVRYVSNFN